MGDTDARVFKKLLNSVQSSTGFIVKTIDRHHIRYATSDRAVVVPAECNSIGDKKYLLLDVEQGYLKWEPPLDRQLYKEELDSLKDDLKAAFEFDGYIVEIDPELTQYGKRRNGGDPIHTTHKKN